MNHCVFSAAFDIMPLKAGLPFKCVSSAVVSGSAAQLPVRINGFVWKISRLQGWRRSVREEDTGWGPWDNKIDKFSSLPLH